MSRNNFPIRTWEDTDHRSVYRIERDVNIGFAGRTRRLRLARRNAALFLSTPQGRVPPDAGEIKIMKPSELTVKSWDSYASGGVLLLLKMNNLRFACDLQYGIPVMANDRERLMRSLRPKKGLMSPCRTTHEPKV